MSPLAHERLDIVESMVKGLRLSEAQRAELLASLRKFRMIDDDDPLLKITFATGIMAQFMAEIPDKMGSRYRQVDESIEAHLANLDEKLKKLISSIRYNSDHAGEVFMSTVGVCNKTTEKCLGFYDRISKELEDARRIQEQAEEDAKATLKLAEAFRKHTENEELDAVRQDEALQAKDRETRLLRFGVYSTALALAVFAMVSLVSSCVMSSRMSALEAQGKRLDHDMTVLTEVVFRSSLSRKGSN